ncbi:MAG: hypothetical protein ACRDTT_02805 [Pseudonocardiaceae bacterium]
MRFLTAFARFWYDFIIGDDWKIAVAVLVALVAAAALLGAGTPTAVLLPAYGVLVVAAFATAIIIDVRTG